MQEREADVVAHLVERLKAIPDGRITMTARRAGIASSQLRKLRRGESPDIRISTLQRLAQGMDTTMAALLGEGPEPPRQALPITADELRALDAIVRGTERLAEAAKRLADFVRRQHERR